MNYLLQDLYSIAYGGLRRDLKLDRIGGFPTNRIIIDVKDTIPFVWTRKHETDYCYDLSMPLIKKDSLGIDGLHKKMQSTLENSWPYIAKTVVKKMLCLVLIKKPGFTLHKSNANTSDYDQDEYSLQMTRCPFHDFTGQLQYIILQMDKRPFIDETGITDSIDLSLTADLSDPVLLAKSLQPYGLDLVEAYRDITVLIISDKPKDFNKN